MTEENDMNKIKRLVSVAMAYLDDGAELTAAQRLSEAASVCQSIGERKRAALDKWMAEAKRS